MDWKRDGVGRWCGDGGGVGVCDGLEERRSGALVWGWGWGRGMGWTGREAGWGVGAGMGVGMW